MLTLHVDLLAGRYLASAADDRRRGEWPPHPARLYSALVDALHAHGAPPPEEREALDALAAAPPPWVRASEAHSRAVLTHYVPVNDGAVTDGSRLFSAAERLAEATAAAAGLTGKAATKAERAIGQARKKLAEAIDRAANGSGSGLSSLPEARLRKDRTFPAVLPHEPRVSYHWPDLTLSSTHLEALRAVAGRVARLGHSASFVALTMETHPMAADDPRRDLRPAAPDEAPLLQLRCPLPGQRAALEQAFERQADHPGRVLPAQSVAYAERHPAGPVRTHWAGGHWITWLLHGPPLPPPAAGVALATAARGALLRHAAEPVPPLLTGHTPDGAPLGRPHLAIVPLPFTGHPHADGMIRGFAALLPPTADPHAVQALWQAIGTWEAAAGSAVPVGFNRLHFTAERIVDPETSLRLLERSRWAGPARRWVTVTPIALDGDVDALYGPTGLRPRALKKATRLIRSAVIRALAAGPTPPPDPEAIQVELSLAPPIRGAEPVRHFPRFQRQGHPRPRPLLHATLTLPEPIEGPLILGAGRYFGLGLCVPLALGEAP